MGTRRSLALVVLYAAVAVVATVPAIGSFGSAFIADGSEARRSYGEAAAGDHLQTAYWLWLPGHQVLEGGPPWRDPYSFQPLVEPRLNPAGWPFAVPFWPLDAAFGTVVAWNLLLLLGVVAAGLATAAWLRALGVGPGAAAVGGLAFAIAPYRLAQSGAHLLGYVAILLPVVLWALERSRAARSPRGAHGFGLLAAIAIVSVPLSGQVHLALGVVAFGAAYAASRFRPVTAAWAAAGIAVAVGVGLLFRETVIAGSATSGGRSLAEVEYYSAGWLDLLSRFRLDGLEQYVYLGWLTPVLAVVGVAVLWRRGRPWLGLTLGLAVCVPALLALGTNLPLYEWLREILPPLRYPRVPGRFMPIAALAVAGLAAAALWALLDRVAPRRRHAAIAGAFVLVAADLLVFPLRAADADPANAAYARLGEAGPGRILELPVLPRGLGHFGSVYLSYAIQEPRERPTGYSTVAPQLTYDFTDRFSRLNCGAWEPGDREALRRLGVRFFVFHAGVFAQASLPGAWFAWSGLQDEGYRPVGGTGPVRLLAAGDGPPAAPPVPEPDRSRLVLCDGWRGFVTVAPRSMLWVFGEGEIGLALGAPSPVTVAVTVDGARPAEVELGADGLTVRVDGLGWHLVEIVAPGPGLVLASRRAAG